MIDEEFQAALDSRNIQLAEPVVLQLQAYAQAMWRFNEEINLTRHTTYDLFVGRDLRDCLQLAPLLQPGEAVLDLGSGNGIPGIPLAILRDDVEIALAESVGKRAKVLDELVSELNLPVAVYAARGEDLLEDFRFTTIVSRAVGSLLKFCRWMQPHWQSVDRLLLVKGPRWVAERGEARHYGVLQGIDLRVVATYPLGDGEPCEPDDSDDRQPEANQPSDQDAPASTTGQGVILQLSRRAAK